MKDSNIRLLLILFFVFYLGLVIGTEFLYREDLFIRSLSIIKNWQRDMSNGQYIFFKFLISLGSAPGFITLLAILHVFFPIHKSFTFLNVFLFSYFFNNWMKILYSSPRPFWIDPEIKKSCNGGFGNPSGHAMCSASVFLAFAHIVTDFKYFTETFVRKMARVLVFLFFIAVIIAIMLSRVYLAAHSVNQILFGSLLGVAIYFFVFNIVRMHKLEGSKFFEFLLNRTWSIISMVVYTILLLIGLITWGSLRGNNNIYEESLQATCGEIDKYRTFYDDGLYGILSLCGLIGAHGGLILLAHYINKGYSDKKDYVNHWYRGRAIHYLYRTILLVLLSFPFMLIYIISGTSSLAIIFIFKVCVPYLLTFFSIYGPCVYLCIHLKICNRHIYDEKNFHSDIEIPNNSHKDLSSNNHFIR